MRLSKKKLFFIIIIIIFILKLHSAENSGRTTAPLLTAPLLSCHGGEPNYNVLNINNYPLINSWSNSKTNNKLLDIIINSSEYIRFNVSSNQTISTWSWYKDNNNMNVNCSSFGTSWRLNGSMTIEVNATYINGTSFTVIWNVTVLPPNGGYWKLNDSLSDEFDGSSINTSKFDILGTEYEVSDGFYKMTLDSGFVGLRTKDAIGKNKRVLLESRTAHMNNGVPDTTVDGKKSIGFNDFKRGNTTTWGIEDATEAYFLEYRRFANWRYLTGVDNIIAINESSTGWEVFWLDWSQNRITGSREQNTPQEMVNQSRSSLQLMYYTDSWQKTGLAPSFSEGFKFEVQSEGNPLNQNPIWIDYIRVYDWIELE